jgi:tetratricopeptide (TPR) repeat protein
MKISNRAVALIFAFVLGLGAHSAASPAQAQTQILDDLFAELLVADAAGWEDVEKQIWTEWSKSGSKAMDLLLQRGRAEMEKGNVSDAINHYSALIDHTPEFAEGWNARATAWFLADRYGLSMSDIRQTLILEPRHFGAMAGLGMILERMDRPEAALKIYQEAEKVHPNRPDVKAAIERLSDKVEGVKL